MFCGFVEERFVLVSRNPAVTLLVLRLSKCQLVLCDSSFAETSLKAYERLGLLSSSKLLESVLIYSSFDSCLLFTVWTPESDPFALEHNDLELQQLDTCGGPVFI